jgi:hypothetical protein
MMTAPRPLDQQPPLVSQHPVLVSPTALALSLLYAGAARRARVTIARSREDFMMRAINTPYAAVVAERGWLGPLDLRRLALRRVFSSTPKLVLVLGRDQVATPFERMRFDSIVVAQPLFAASASDLQELVRAVPAGPITLPGVRDQRGFQTSATYLT